MFQVSGRWFPSLSWRLYAPALFVWVANYASSHFGWSLPAILTFCFLMSTKSPKLIWRGFTFLFLHRAVSAWYKGRLFTAWHLSSSTRSFVSCSLSWVVTTSFAKVTLGDLCVSSSGRIASSLKRSLNGVTLLLSTQRCYVTKWLRWAPLPIFLWAYCAIFLRCLGELCQFALSTRPLDCGCLTEAKHTFVLICK